jgi:hypothetical protein
MEIRWGNLSYFQTLNPELWLAPPQGWGVFVGSFKDNDGAFLSRHPIVITYLETGQLWRARTYAGWAVNSDPYYQENIVVSDLPAGSYSVEMSYKGKLHTVEIEVYPGRVSYVSLRGSDGFNLAMPPSPGEDFTPKGPLDK